MNRLHGVAQRLGLTLGATGTIAALVAGLGCSPTETVDYRTDNLSRPIGQTGSFHITVVLSRAAVEQGDDGFYLSASALSNGDVDVDLVPDDASLEAWIDNADPGEPGDAGTSINTSDLAALCPAEGDCRIGLTVLVESTEDDATSSVHAQVRRLVADGRFTADATVTIIED